MERGMFKIKKNTQRRDAFALAIIQQAVHEQLFSRIAAANTSKEAWETLRMEFQGDTQVQSIKLQGLRRDFKNLSMKDDEPIGDYFSRIMCIVSQRRAYGEVIEDQSIVEKVLRSLTPRFDYVVPSIEVSHDLSKLTPVKLMGSLQSHEERLNRRTPEKQSKTDEQALQVMFDWTQSESGSRGRGRNSSRGRGRGRGRNFNKNKVPQCTVCIKFGHQKRDCWYNEEQHVNVANDEDNLTVESTKEEPRLFMAIVPEPQLSLMTNTTTTGNKTCLWFLDSGCSNHMTGLKHSFSKLDESFKLVVHLGDKKEIQV
ncbi:uncharacterized protein LOC143627494 [Bidens hawaiensis]|uniref:uncharacterized protein LOC143627494 n=1 Tax=Bidens hawaiensis TaxID=980011 RepID=UPI00404A5D0A